MKEMINEANIKVYPIKISLKSSIYLLLLYLHFETIKRRSYHDSLLTIDRIKEKRRKLQNNWNSVVTTIAISESPRNTLILTTILLIIKKWYMEWYIPLCLIETPLGTQWNIMFTWLNVSHEFDSIIRVRFTTMWNEAKCIDFEYGWKLHKS